MINIAGGIVLAFLVILTLLRAYSTLMDWGYKNTNYAHRPLWYRILRGPS